MRKPEEKALAERVTFRTEGEMPPLVVSVASTLYNRTGSWRYLRPIYRDKTPPCREACPAGEDIEGYMYLAARERWDEAWELIMQENPLPAICGRVCYHPCESGCNRKEFDEPLSINAIERVIGDHGLDFQDMERLRIGESKGQKIAVVGSGPAGLTCAYHLARLGYQVVVFEAHDKPGGVLRFGIPDYRLPKDILDKEIARIGKLGAVFETDVVVGRDVPWEQLEREFEAIFIAIGVHKSRKMRVPGEELKGVISGLEFLKAVNTHKKVEIGERVAVIGGGNTAMDAARTALRLGKRPAIYYRRTRAEMPAIPDEIEEAEREGIPIEFLVAPARIIGLDGQVKGVEFIRMRLGEPDESGRRRPIPIEGSNFQVPVDTVITAIGEQADFSHIPEGLDIRNGVVTIDGSGFTNLRQFFAGGDVVDQPHTVVHAIGSGKRAAMAIDAFLSGDRLESRWSEIKIGHKGSLSMQRYVGDLSGDIPDNHDVVDFKHINLDYFEKACRQPVRELAVANRITNFAEVKIGYDRKAAVQEAQRCFNCGVCNMCDNCLIFCPDAAISRRENGYRYQINYDYCKGCGICAYECPRNAISMVSEGR